MATRAEAKKAIWDSMPHKTDAQKDKARKAIVEFFEKNPGEDCPGGFIDDKLLPKKAGK